MNKIPTEPAKDPKPAKRRPLIRYRSWLMDLQAKAVEHARYVRRITPKRGRVSHSRLRAAQASGAELARLVSAQLREYERALARELAMVVGKRKPKGKKPANHGA